MLINVENINSIYHASVKQPSGMKVAVQFSIVLFSGKYSNAEFNMTVEIEAGFQEFPIPGLFKIILLF